MGGLAIAERFIGTLTPTIGTNAQDLKLEMPRDYWYAGLQLRVSGTLTIAGGTTNGTLHDENPMSLLDKIQIEATGGDRPYIMKSVHGPIAYRLHHLYTGSEPGGTSPIASAAVQTATAFSALIPIWFMLPGAEFPSELKVWSALNPREFDQLMLTISFGTPSAFINGGDRTTTVPTCSVEVSALQIMNMRQLVDKASGKPMRPYRFVERELFQETTSAIVSDFGSEYGTKLTVGLPYRSLLIRTTNEASNARQPVDDALTRLILQAGQTKVLDFRKNTQWIERHKQAVFLSAAANPAGLNPLSSRDNPVVGYNMFDFMRDGRFEGWLDTRKYSINGTTLQLFRDIGTASARVHRLTAGFFIPGGAL
jgi:hypothetical protein